MTTIDLTAAGWPAERLGEGLEALARLSRLRGRSLWVPAPPPAVIEGDRQAVDRWLSAAGAHIGLEIETVTSRYEHLEQLVSRGAPLILQLPMVPPRYLLAVRSRRRSIDLLTLELGVLQVSPATMRSALCQHWEQPTLVRIETMLDQAGVPARRRARARKALLTSFLGTITFDHFWIMRHQPAASFWRQLRRAGVAGRLSITGVSHLVQYLLTLAAWWVIGRGALSGRLDGGWLLAWALLLLTTVPFQLLAFWHQGRFLISASGLLKRRLLGGLLRLDAEEVRTLGAGQFLGRVVESEAVESLLLTGGYQTLLAVPELVMAAVVLGAGAGGIWHAGTLVAWTLLAGAVAVLLYRVRDRWTWTRLLMTHDLVERMVGHRTRIVQQPVERWHEGEDLLLNAYFDDSRRLDLLGPVFAALPAGWRVLGILGLAGAFVRGGASLAGVAVGLGGILLAQQALARFAGGLGAITGALVAWKRVGPIFHAVTRPIMLGSPDVQASLPTTEPGEELLDARDLSFSYPSRPQPVLDRIDLQIHQGERLLLTGPSGGGKSTLAALLAGLRTPGSGLVLLRGLDLDTLGAGTWRDLVAAAPQFHENHVLAETFAFNLLMGRRWPASAPDLEEAVEICQELGLGEVLERMPSGLQQVVGDTGWQLSHGERSRLYVARALLQGAELVILDESFGALDPENLQLAIACAQRRARTLLVIAHP